MGTIWVKDLTEERITKTFNNMFTYNGELSQKIAQIQSWDIKISSIIDRFEAMEEIYLKKGKEK